ncbi:transposase [Streptomyces mirabilis]|uniref:transposase n=1 Tax=Streptomyces mirabilis TaxID=68239 RepID=UPI0036EBD453
MGAGLDQRETHPVPPDDHGHDRPAPGPVSQERLSRLPQRPDEGDRVEPRDGRPATALTFSTARTSTAEQETGARSPRPQHSPPGPGPHPADALTALPLRHDRRDNGIEWRAMPADYPPWRTIYGFARRWAAAGIVSIALSGTMRLMQPLSAPCPPT